MAVDTYPFAEADYAARIVLEPTTDGGTVYSAWYVELPGCESQGDTPEEARRNLRDAFALYVGDLLKRAVPVPAPSAREVKEIVSFYSGTDADASPCSVNPDGAIHRGQATRSARGGHVAVGRCAMLISCPTSGRLLSTS
jgi:predicted RNase H-like HicB family nuclease